NVVVNLPDSVIDRNGNLISISTSPSTVLSVADTLGRNEIAMPTFGSGTSMATVAGQAYQLTWQSITSTGLSISSQSHSTSTVCAPLPSFAEAMPPGGGSTTNVVKSISLPNGQQ